MKVVLTGGATGGHFYPNIAVAQAINIVAKERKIVSLELFYTGPSEYDSRALFENSVTFRKIQAAKFEDGFSLKNIVSVFAIAASALRAIWVIFIIYPDVVFSTGGYASFPTLFAARFLRIPVVILNADADPGRVSLWSAKFAQKIAIGFPDAADSFKKYESKVAYTGNPVRSELMTVAREGAYEFLKLPHTVPVVLVLGGSQGAKVINDTILDALPALVEEYQIIHQTGASNLEEVEDTAAVILENNKYGDRYKTFNFLNPLALRMAAGVAAVIVSRAGAGSISAIATWGLPSIIVPIPESISADQLRNAFSYARSGAATVIKQSNLSPSILVAEIRRIVQSDAIQKEMGERAREFTKRDASKKLAEAIVQFGLKHDS
jgi:UDP-N-acetylglucosamine--N-acetylmuramyl-(pentapeptide) pyrophosphoryl-undecaprenol N-acetylglucosamine transferase